MPLKEIISSVRSSMVDAKEFSMPGQNESITARPQCTAPPNCRGCQRPPCRRDIGEAAPLIRK